MSPRRPRATPDSPPARRPRTGRRLVLAGALGALLASLAPSAGGVLLWKRKQVRPTPPTDLRESPRGASRPAPEPSEQEGLARAAAAALGAPHADGAPEPEVVTTYAHELRRLAPLAAALHEPELSPASLAVAHLRYGNGLANLGYDADAAAAYAAALELDPGLAAAWNNLGSILRRDRQHELARAVFDHVLRLDPRNGLGWFNLAMTLEARGDFEGADDAYVRALQLDPALWVPSRNPLIIGNDRAERALHLGYLARHGGGGVHLAEPDWVSEDHSGP